jgi:hypothetical protein
MAALQAGLDFCANYHSPSSTVQLQAGKYPSSPLLERNFDGTFKGAGEGQTTIQALSNLVINLTNGCLPNLTDCQAATFITFIDGKVEVSDLALDITGATPGSETSPWAWGVGLVPALEFRPGSRRESLGRPCEQ